jgi:hypothetical protein
MPTITRWTPPCNCVIEKEISDDKKEHKFLLLNDVCNEHKVLASTKHKSNHSELSKHVIDLIEEAKAVNLKQVDDLIAVETSPRKKKHLMGCRTQVLRFNNDVTEEWNELVTQTHAFDELIHDKIVKELG